MRNVGSRLGGTRLRRLPAPSLLAVEVGVAVVPYLAFVVLTTTVGLFAGGGGGTIGGVAVWLLLLGLLGVVGLPALLLVHAAVDVGGLVRSGPWDSVGGEWTARRAAHVGVRTLETVGAALYLDLLREASVTFGRDLPAPAGVGIVLAVAVGFVLLSVLVVAHGVARVALGAGTRSYD
jgi:hypothetical protein